MPKTLTNEIKESIENALDYQDHYETENYQYDSRDWAKIDAAKAWIAEQVPFDAVREPEVSRGEIMAPMPDSPQALQTSKGLKPFTDRGYDGTD